MTMTDETLDYDLDLDPGETEDMLLIHQVSNQICDRMNKSRHPDPFRTLLAIGRAWLSRVDQEGGPDAMADELLKLERAANYGTMH